MRTNTDRRRAVRLVVDKNRTMASVGREFGVTARTVRRWIDAIYPPSPLQYMTNMYGGTSHIRHPHGGLIPQKYNDLNSDKRRKLREEYVGSFGGACAYCFEKLDGEPDSFVRDSADDIEWDDVPGFKEGFLKNPIHLHHDHETGMTLAAVHALCNAHSWHFHEVPARIEKLIDHAKANGIDASELKANILPGNHA